VSFSQLLVQQIPSSSAQSESHTAFAELIVDLIWAVDNEVEEDLISVKTISTKTSEIDAAVSATAESIKKVAERRRALLVEVVTGLRVRGSFFHDLVLNSTYLSVFRIFFRFIPSYRLDFVVTDLTSPY
jgi:hypothetical protein